MVTSITQLMHIKTGLNLHTANMPVMFHIMSTDNHIGDFVTMSVSD